jgi:PAS domain S-box-containing protein
LEGTQLQIDHIFEKSPIGMAVIDFDGCYRMVNPAYVELYGYAVDEMLGQHFSMVMSQGDQALALSLHQKFLTSGGELKREWRVNRRDGAVVDISSESVRVTSNTGLPNRLVYVLDITERKRAELLLRQSESKLRSLFDWSPLGLQLTNVKGQYIEVNAAFCDITGYTRDELIGSNYRDITPVQYQEVDGTRLVASNATNLLAPFEKEYIHKDGHLVPVRLLGVQVEGDGGQAAFWIIVEDITQRRRVQAALIAAKENAEGANRELARSNADLEQFAYVASHDLQEPLRSVAGSVQLLQKRYAGHLDARADEFITHAVSGVTRMQALINDLFTFSKVASTSRQTTKILMESALTAAIANLEMAIVESNAQNYPRLATPHLRPGQPDHHAAAKPAGQRHQVSGRQSRDCACGRSPSRV